ncbi:MAG: SRPBCC family protein [Desulfomonilia bacterium]|jgi:uncharacterized membrane protein
MPKIHSSIEIKAPVKKVYDYLDNPENAPEHITNMIDVRDVRGSGSGRQFKWSWKMAGMKFDGETTVTEDVPEKKLVFKSKGGIESIWTCKFEPKGDSTVLDLDIDYSIPVPVLGRFAEKVLLRRNERETKMNMENLKDRLES